MRTNSFISLYNKSGIACASDTDYTIYRFSKEEPVAVAVCPFSPIPWESIITAYLRKGEPAHRLALEEYARDFEQFLQTYPADKAWNWLSANALSLIFLGYGTNDIYPSACDTLIVVDEETGKMKLGEISNTAISIDNEAAFNWNGDFERMSPILHGTTQAVKEFIFERVGESIELYKKRVLDKFNGTKYEEYVKKSLDNYDFEDAQHSLVYDATGHIQDRVCIGLDSFSIEDLVLSCENMVNANIRLNHLANGGKGLIGSTREIAVLTRAEGFTWIKHSLFAI